MGGMLGVLYPVVHGRHAGCTIPGLYLRERDTDARSIPVLWEIMMDNEARSIPVQKVRFRLF